VNRSELVGSVGFERDSTSLLYLFDPQKILTWIAEDTKNRLWPIAHSTPIEAAPMPVLARELIVKWGGRREVTGALAAAFGTGSWVGPMSGYYRHLLDILSAWEKDPAPAVRQFAQTLRVGYEQEAAEQKKREEDRGW